jgi:bifunctional isochorismate lyase/aryl carrier protein
MAQFKIDTQKLVLIVHDMQRIFVQGPYTADKESSQLQVGKIKELVDLCRTKKIPIVYTMFCYRRDGADLGIVGEFWEEIRKREILVDDQEESQIVPELAPRNEDIVIRKVGSYSALHNTPLESILRNLRRDTIVITGCGTNVGCEALARDAHSRGLKAILLEDLSSAVELPDLGWGEISVEMAQRVSCTTIARCIGQVIKSTDFIKQLA